MTHQPKTQAGQIGASAPRKTAKQRCIIDAQLGDIGKGPYHGPFETADDAIQFLHDEIRQRVRKATDAAKTADPLPTYKPTKKELAAIRRGEAAIARGEYVSLNKFLS
jgi:hypothetical protein